MKSKLLKLLAFLLIGLTTNSFSATLTEDFTGFNAVTGTGYYNGTINGWDIAGVSGLSDASRARSGTECLKFDNTPASGHYAISPVKTGGIGTIEFWYSHWDGGSPTVTFDVQTSSDKSTWTTISSITCSSKTYTQYLQVINNASLTYVRILKTGGSERLIVDDFSVTDAAGGCTGYYIDSIGTTICAFDSAEFRGTFYKTAGLYKDTVTSTCDTIFMFNLITTNYTSYDAYDTICSSDSLLFNGSYLKTAGIYYDTIARVGDCDSIVKLDLFLEYCPTPCNDLFFSEYIEGSGSNKAIEIYNPTASAINLSGYKINLYYNGGSGVGTSISLTGIIPAYGVYVVSNSGASGGSGIPAVSDITSGVANFNGNDPLELLNGTTSIDVIGVIGGGSSNFAKDKTLIRNANVSSGNTTYTTSEWTVLAKDYTTDIGMHTSDCYTVCTPTRDTIIETVCFADSATNGVNFYKVSGFHADTLTSVLTGCDSIRVLDLTVSTLSRDTIKDTICEGATYALGSSMYTVAGTYSDTAQNTAGCDSIGTVVLFVTPVIRDTTADTICMGATFTFGTKMYTVAGTYSDTAQNAAGCDSIATVKLFVTPVIRDTIADTICMGATFTFGTKMYTVAGTYSDTAQNAAGCDSIATVKLFVTPVIRDTTADTICMGATFTFGTKMYSVAGTYSDTAQNAAGCDSIATVKLFVTPVIRDTTADTICMGATFTFGTKMYTVAGTYSDTAQNAAGCDSIATVKLFVTPVIRDTIADTICQGASITFGTETLTMSGTYADTTQNTAGCDSITVLKLLVNDYIRDTIADTICQGASVVFGTQTLIASGNYSDTMQNTAGCDSITVLKLLVNDYIRDTIADTICQGASVVFGTQTLIANGNYSDTMQNASGCDSITVMQLKVNLAPRDTIADTICQGASVVFGTQTLTVSGTYADTSQTAAGCDSITVMELLVNDYIRDTIADTICQGGSIMFGTQTLTMSGNYSDTMQNTSGCDSITVMQLLVNDYIRDTIADTICQGGSIMFGTQTLSMSGNYSDTMQNASGCDSITVMQLLVNDYIRDTIADTICQGGSIMFGTQTLSMSGTYVDTTQTASGCDSITVMELLVNDYIRDTIADTICQGGSMMFGTQILTMSGTYVDTTQTTAGCDSITVMNLMINAVPRDTIVRTICSGSSYAFRGNSYSAAGMYVDTMQTAAGCDSITTLDLRVTLIVTTNNITLCAGRSFRVGPSLYSTAGTYTDVFPSSSGCDSTIITNLSFYAPATGNMNYNICVGDSIQVLGNWYFSSTVISDTIIAGSSNGCDSITTHTITTRTVTPALSLGADVVSCITGGVTIIAPTGYDSYSWSNGGTTNILSVTGAVSGISSTDYILNVTQSSTGCAAADTVNVKFLACVGLDENEADLTVNLFPNPATNYVTVEVYNKYNAENMKLEILNSLGQVVSERAIYGQSEKVMMDVTSLSKGMYFVRISSNKMNMTKKLLIQR